MNLPFKVIERIFRDLAAEELAQSRADSSILEASQDWNQETAIRDRDEDGEGSLGVDSLELLQVATRANEYFHLSEFGMADSILRGKTVGDWARLIEEAIQPDWETLTVRSSGTTGEPKAFDLLREDLEAECEHWVQVLGPVRRLVSLVPAHHLYGLIWTGLLPSAFGEEPLEVIEARWQSGTSWLAELKPGDLVVGFPFRFRLLTQTRGTQRIPRGVSVVSSAGALAPSEWETLTRIGFERILEIYGASEAGGIGWRTQPDEDFQLAPYWEHRREELKSLPDHLEWTSEDQFSLCGRKDGLLKVGGKLVDPVAVARLISQHPKVRDCIVWQESQGKTAPAAHGEEPRLRAFVVPEDEVRTEQSAHSLSQEIRRWLEPQLPAAARPAHIEFGAEIPRTALGKQRLSRTVSDTVGVAS